MMSLVGLCYLPLDEISSALEELGSFEFDPEMDPDDLKKIQTFAPRIIQYTKENWLEGQFPPRDWNYWMHGRNNTNNRYNESFNIPFFADVDVSHNICSLIFQK